jgi:cell division protein FtsB
MLLETAETSSNIFKDYAPLWSFLTALFGGVGLTVANNWLARRKQGSDIATDLRDELRKENVQLKEERDKLYNENEELKNKVAAARGLAEELESRILRRKWEDGEL